jgi:hypothetical protein
MNVSTALKENNRYAFKYLAITLSLVVYLAGLLYGAVRSYTLFASTVDSDLLPLAVIGIVALELSALALPLAVHFWTAPGSQRLAALGFYVLDLALIVGNSILDAAHHSGVILPTFLLAYSTYAVPALPVLCMIGWALIWALDPYSRERDMAETVKAATHEALMSQIQKAAESVDISRAVEDAANEAARALVGETLGRAPRVPTQPATPMPVSTSPMLAMGDGEEMPDFPTAKYPAVKPSKPSRNGHKPVEDMTTGPKS